MDCLPPLEGFLGLDQEHLKRGADTNNRVLVIPFGLEASVTYGHGTAQGPRAILAASKEVETFDCELWTEPCDHFRIDTRIPDPVPDNVTEALTLLQNRVEEALIAGYFPLILGGEHGLTPGAIRPFVARYPNVCLVHFDAHADLRDGYLGQHYSHASAMRRCLDHPQVELVSLGIRNLSRQEANWLENAGERVHIFWAHDKPNWSLESLRHLISGKKVYLSFDVDAFDASLMPATGTPEPGGLFWDDVMPILKMLMQHSEVLGADITELAPIPGLHACDFLVARLAYKIMSYRFLLPSH
ncbi:MAG: agmatinase family protein [Magnetococcales bacterium]|nr:agmatinase family protein [Magnetococcales bacterium]